MEKAKHLFSLCSHEELVCWKRNSLIDLSIFFAILLFIRVVRAGRARLIRIKERQMYTLFFLVVYCTRTQHRSNWHRDKNDGFVQITKHTRREKKINEEAESEREREKSNNHSSRNISLKTRKKPNVVYLVVFLVFNVLVEATESARAYVCVCVCYD